MAAVVNTFGFGSDHNATLLEAISERGAGVYYYIDQNEKIPESFADCLGGLLSTVGQNVSLNFAAVDGATLTKVHHRRADALTDAGTHCVVNLGDVQSEEGKDIVVEMKLPPLAEPRDEPTVVLTAELGYFNAITNVMETTTTTLRVRRPGVVSEECKRPNRQIDQQRNRVIAAAAMKRATTLADQNQLEEARKVIDQVKSSNIVGFVACDTEGGTLAEGFCHSTHFSIGLSPSQSSVFIAGTLVSRLAGITVLISHLLIHNYCIYKFSEG